MCENRKTTVVLEWREYFLPARLTINQKTVESYSFGLAFFIYVDDVVFLIRCKVMIQSAELDNDDDDDDEAQLKSRKTVSGALRAIWKKEGILGFFKGLQAQILKTVLSSALLLMVKEKITKSTWVLMIALRRFMFITRTRLKSS